MPVKKEGSQYKWGENGKLYPTKKQALRQGRAIYASKHRKK